MRVERERRARDCHKTNPVFITKSPFRRIIYWLAVQTQLDLAKMLALRSFVRALSTDVPAFTKAPVVGNAVTKANEQQKDLAKEQQQSDGLTLQELKTDRPLLYPDQMEWLDGRIVRISRPSKNVMQSGTFTTKNWKIEFDSQPRGEYWLMGWTSSADPVSNLTLNFPDKESAIAFCEKNKLQWFLEEQPERKVRKKSYADNFSWNKRTRLGNK